MAAIDLSSAGDQQTIAHFENLQKSGILPPAATSPDGVRLLGAIERERARAAGRDPSRVAKEQFAPRGSSSDLHNRTAAEAVQRGDRGWVAADLIGRIVEHSVGGGAVPMGGATPNHDPRVAGGLAGTYDGYDARNPGRYYDAEALSLILNDRAARAETTAKASLAVDLFKMREHAMNDPSYAEAIAHAEKKAKEKGHRRDIVKDYDKKLAKLQRKSATRETLAKSAAPMFKQTWDGRSVDDIRRSWGLS